VIPKLLFYEGEVGKGSLILLPKNITMHSFTSLNQESWWLKTALDANLSDNFVVMLQSRGGTMVA
jgi:hypothetical protein